MLRGVNKQIIEVKDTGSRYFERALLFVRPEFAEMRPGQLEAEADKFLATVGRPPSTRPAGTGPVYRRESMSGPLRRELPAGHAASYAARMARVRRRRRLLGMGVLALVLTAVVVAILYLV